MEYYVAIKRMKYDICSNMDRSQNILLSKRSQIQDNLLHDTIYIKFKNRVRELEIPVVVAWWWWWWGVWLT